MMILTLILTVLTMIAVIILVAAGGGRPPIRFVVMALRNKGRSATTVPKTPMLRPTPVGPLVGFMTAATTWLTAVKNATTAMSPAGTVARLFVKKKFAVMTF